ncbi:hypothetical protein KAJ27_11870, partial [bacterium]|nr:hypothetical protein [bacterium]
MKGYLKRCSTLLLVVIMLMTGALFGTTPYMIGDIDMIDGIGNHGDMTFTFNEGGWLTLELTPHEYDSDSPGNLLTWEISVNNSTILGVDIFDVNTDTFRILALDNDVFSTFEAQYTATLTLRDENGSFTQETFTVEIIAIDDPPKIIVKDTENPWWNPDWNYRVNLKILDPDYERTNLKMFYDLDFTEKLSLFGKAPGTYHFEPDYVKVILVDSSGNPLIYDGTKAGNLKYEVPCTFYPASDYDEENNAKGMVVWNIDGDIPQNTEKRYQIYFDISENIKIDNVIYDVPAPVQSAFGSGMELYGRIIEDSTFSVKAIASYDNTVINLYQISASGKTLKDSVTLNKFGTKTWSKLDLNTLGLFTDATIKLESNKTICGYLSDFVGNHFVVIPAIDTGLGIGNEFIFYQHNSTEFYIFSMNETATVDIFDSLNNPIPVGTLFAHQFKTPNIADGVYRIKSTGGKIMVMNVGGKSFSGMPSFNGTSVGKEFYYSSKGAIKGGVFLMAQEYSFIEIYSDVAGTNRTKTLTLLTGEARCLFDIGLDKEFYITSTGNISMYAGDFDGAATPTGENMGDGLGFTSPYFTKETYTMNIDTLNHEATIFSFFENTELKITNVDTGTTDNFTIGRDKTHNLAGFGHFMVESNNNITAQVLGEGQNFATEGTYMGGGNTKFTLPPTIPEGATGRPDYKFTLNEDTVTVFTIGTWKSDDYYVSTPPYYDPQPTLLSWEASDYEPTLISVSIDNSNPTNPVTITPVPDAYGSCKLQLKLTDTGGLTSIQEYYVIVNSVNDAPTIVNKPIELVFDEDQAYTYSLSTHMTDIDNSTSDLHWSVDGFNSEFIQSAEINGNSLILTPVSNAATLSTEVVVRLHDKFGLTDTHSIKVKINPLPDLPYFSTSFPDSPWVYEKYRNSWWKYDASGQATVIVLEMYEDSTVQDSNTLKIVDYHNTYLTKKIDIDTTKEYYLEYDIKQVRGTNNRSYSGTHSYATIDGSFLPGHPGSYDYFTDCGDILTNNVWYHRKNNKISGNPRTGESSNTSEIDKWHTGTKFATIMFLFNYSGQEQTTYIKNLKFYESGNPGINLLDIYGIDWKDPASWSSNAGMGWDNNLSEAKVQDPDNVFSDFNFSWNAKIISYFDHPAGFSDPFIMTPAATDVTNWFDIVDGKFVIRPMQYWYGNILVSMTVEDGSPENFTAHKEFTVRVGNYNHPPEIYPKISGVDPIYPWWDAKWRYRAKVKVDTLGEERYNYPVKLSVDLKEQLLKIGAE